MRRSMNMKLVNRIQNLHPNVVSTCKMLFLLILALSVSSGVCDVLYKEAGKEVSLQCGASPNSDIEWRLNNNLLISIRGKSGLRRKGSGHSVDKVNLYGDTLKIPRLEPRDSGVYSCAQSGKQYTLHVVSVFVKPGPVLIQSSDVELHCNIEGDPNTEVEWLRPPNDQVHDAKHQKINLKSVTSSDEGKWTCKVEDLKLSVTLTVVANHQINNVEVSEGDDIELPCFLPRPVSQSVLGGKWKADHLPTVPFPTLKNTADEGLHWDGVNSSEVKYNIERLSTNFNVTLINVQSSFAGKFVCEVEFEHGGKLTAVTNLMVLAETTDKTDLHALCVSPGVCEVLLYQGVGKEVSLQCGASSNSDIEWRLNNILLISIRGKSGLKRKGSGHTADKVNLYGDTLKVPRLEPRDSGVYSCTQSGKQYTLHVVSVFVKPGPVLIQSSDVELHCNIEGDPNTEVEWLRPPNDQIHDAKHQVIHLKSVTLNDGGKWTCVVNDFKFSVTLTVVANHQINNVEVSEGFDIELPCFLPRPVSQSVLGGKWKADHLPTVPFPTLKNTADEGLHWDGVNSSVVKYNIERISTIFNVTLKKVQSIFAGKFVCEVEFEHGGKLTAVTNLTVKSWTDGNDGKTSRNPKPGLDGRIFRKRMFGVELWIWIAVGASSVVLVVLIIGIVCMQQKNKQKKRRVRKLRSMRQPLTAKDYCQCNRSDREVVLCQRERPLPAPRQQRNLRTAGLNHAYEHA
eukprot:XP_021328637.1 hemicentin-2 isoform X3 [Danio rerio]